MLGKKTKETEAVAARPARSNAVPDRGTSVISKEMRIEGDCIVEGSVRIEGRISGSVKALGLELAESGSVEGDLSAAGAGGKDGRAFIISGRVDGSVDAPRVDITPTGSVLQGVVADEAHVRGRIEGGIVARHRLVLEETAVVEGDVRARRLALKEGGQVNGTILMGDRATQETGSSATSSPAQRSSRSPSSSGPAARKPDEAEAEAPDGKHKDEQEVLAKTGANDSEG